MHELWWFILGQVPIVDEGAKSLGGPNGIVWGLFGALCAVVTWHLRREKECREERKAFDIEREKLNAGMQTEKDKRIQTEKDYLEYVQKLVQTHADKVDTLRKEQITAIGDVSKALAGLYEMIRIQQVSTTVKPQ